MSNMSITSELETTQTSTNTQSSVSTNLMTSGYTTAVLTSSVIPNEGTVTTVETTELINTTEFMVILNQNSSGNTVTVAVAVSITVLLIVTITAVFLTIWLIRQRKRSSSKTINCGVQNIDSGIGFGK